MRRSDKYKNIKALFSKNLKFFFRITVISYNLTEIFYLHQYSSISLYSSVA